MTQSGHRGTTVTICGQPFTTLKWLLAYELSTGNKVRGSIVFNITRLGVALAVVAMTLTITNVAYAGDDPTEYMTKAKQAESRLDYRDALTWYEKAAELGDAEAMDQIGWLYFGAHDIPGRHFRDLSKAAIWFQKAASLNYIPAITQLANMHNSDGSFGVPEDRAKAAQLYLIAANAGSARAMNNLAVMYLQGKGVPRDISKAVYWWRKAVEVDKNGASGSAAQTWLAIHDR